MKTKEELNALKNEVKSLNKKLAELSEDELKEVTGGTNLLNTELENAIGSTPETDFDQTKKC